MSILHYKAKIHEMQIPRAPVFCANCGGFGHIYKTCNHPITSYGIICYRLCYNKHDNTISPKYLLVQRKDSLSFVEFLRGKYDVNNTQYLLRLFTNMTEDERQRISESSFETLWKEMWCKTSIQDSNKNFTKEYNDSKEKFETLKRGVFIKSPKDGIYYFDIHYIMTNSKSEFDETEWGFPKGRRNINEEDVSCAIREFREETGIHPRNIRVCEDIKPLEEVFSGTNKVRYKHVYYVARYVSPAAFGEATTPTISPNNIEIRDIQWFDYHEAQKKIRKVNVERRELFKRLNQMVVRNINGF